MEGNEFLAQARTRLASAGFDVLERVSYDGLVFDLVAIRKRIEATKLGAAHTFFLCATFPSLDSAALGTYAEACFDYVNSTHRSGMPRGLGTAVACFPVALLRQPDDTTIETVRKRPARRHWAGIVMPVVVDLGSDQLHFLEKTPVWGAAYYRGYRKMIRELLSPH